MRQAARALPQRTGVIMHVWKMESAQWEAMRLVILSRHART
jgi:hypothetical protein